VFVGTKISWTQYAIRITRDTLLLEYDEIVASLRRRGARDGQVTPRISCAESGRAPISKIERLSGHVQTTFTALQV
jgi:hypothetical protein